MLTYWIPEGPCMLPANASHQVGVGGFVINDNNEVCVASISLTSERSKLILTDSFIRYQAVIS